MTAAPVLDLADEIWCDADAGPLVRPYALTRGRVAAEADGLDLTTVVVAGPAPTGLEELSPEQAEILRSCAGPTSVAEIAAHLGLPLGTVRVLLTDLRAIGLITIAEGEREPDGPSTDVMRQVLAGLWEL